jgi:hypothetical protein
MFEERTGSDEELGCLIHVEDCAKAKEMLAAGQVVLVGVRE